MNAASEGRRVVAQQRGAALPVAQRHTLPPFARVRFTLPFPSQAGKKARRSD